ncbi:MAG: hypothetical protein HQK63_02115 [Desulfamplus sp.]|nr:hypothetical protein [Desulfamplus sp.]
MSVQVIIYSSDRIRGGIVKEILRRNNIGTVLLEKIIDVKSEISSHLPAIIIFDTNNFLKNEVKFLRTFLSSLESCSLILLGNPLITNSLKGFEQLNLIQLPDPLDPDKIASKSIEILYSVPLQTGLDAPLQAGVNTPFQAGADTPLQVGVEDNRPNIEIDEIQSLENDLKQYLKLLD